MIVRGRIAWPIILGGARCQELYYVITLVWHLWNAFQELLPFLWQLKQISGYFISQREKAWNMRQVHDWKSALLGVTTQQILWLASAIHTGLSCCWWSHQSLLEGQWIRVVLAWNVYIAWSIDKITNAKWNYVRHLRDGCSTVVQ